MTYFSTEVPSQRNTQQERETRDGRRRDLIAPRQDVVEEDSASESSDSGESESENDCVSKSGCERVFSSRKSSVYSTLHLVLIVARCILILLFLFCAVLVMVISCS